MEFAIKNLHLRPIIIHIVSTYQLYSPSFNTLTSLPRSSHIPTQLPNRPARREGGRPSTRHVPHRVSSQIPLGKQRLRSERAAKVQEVRADSQRDVGQVSTGRGQRETRCKQWV